MGATLAACSQCKSPANVLLALAQALLRRGGIIIANELTTKTDFLTLTFGLTDGWWLYDDPHWRMPGMIVMRINSQCTGSNGYCLILEGI